MHTNTFPYASLAYEFLKTITELLLQYMLLNMYVMPLSVIVVEVIRIEIKVVEAQVKNEHSRLYYP